jgi:hypothetical protein
MNIEKYNKLHSEIMNRLENGEITVETAKEINDLAFDKYITESKIIDFIKKKLKPSSVKNISTDNELTTSTDNLLFNNGQINMTLMSKIINCIQQVLPDGWTYVKLELAMPRNYNESNIDIKWDNGKLPKAELLLNTTKAFTKCFDLLEQSQKQFNFKKIYIEWDLEYRFKFKCDYNN